MIWIGGSSPIFVPEDNSSKACQIPDWKQGRGQRPPGLRLQVCTFHSRYLHAQENLCFLGKMEINNRLQKTVAENEHNHVQKFSSIGPGNRTRSSSVAIYVFQHHIIISQQSFSKNSRFLICHDLLFLFEMYVSPEQGPNLLFVQFISLTLHPTSQSVGAQLREHVYRVEYFQATFKYELLSIPYHCLFTYLKLHHTSMI